MDITATLGPVSVLSITGNIGGSNFQQLVDKVDEVVQKGHTRLVLDFQGVPYLSSAGIVALQTILGQITNHGGQLALTRVSPQVFQTFDIVGATKWLNLHPDVASALASLGGANS